MLSTRNLKSLLALFALLFVSTGSVLAQTAMPQQQTVKPEDITDQELKQFAATAQQMQKAQMKGNQKVKKKVEEKGMKFPRFRKIMMSKQNPKMAGKVEVTDREQKMIKELQPELMQIQKESRQEMMTVIQNSDLGMQRFQQIAQAVQQNPKLMKRVQNLTQGESES
jgi:hemolysin activation/secretion protein